MGTLLLGQLAIPVSAEDLRIAPEDLKIRVAVSQLLAPSLRLELRDLAAGTPLPQEGGVMQTEDLLAKAFADRAWDEDRQQLVAYFFLVARMERSRDFSREFTRRREVTEEGRTLMQAYVADLNRAIARAVFVPDLTVELGPQRSFPLTEVGWEEADGKKTLQVLHDYPEVSTELGRETLRGIRDVAVVDMELLEGQLSDIDDAERAFLAEVSLVGKELIALRPHVTKLVRLPRAGLPFSF